MGNYLDTVKQHDSSIIKENIIRYDITLHKLINNDKHILNSEKNMEKHVDNDIALITNITDCNKNIMELSPYYNQHDNFV